MARIQIPEKQIEEGLGKLKSELYRRLKEKGYGMLMKTLGLEICLE
jgi:hypothetical protein